MLTLGIYIIYVAAAFVLDFVLLTFVCRPSEIKSASIRLRSDLNVSLEVSGGAIASSFANILISETKKGSTNESKVDLMNCMPSCVAHLPIAEWLFVLVFIVIAVTTLKFERKVCKYKLSMIYKWKAA